MNRFRQLPPAFTRTELLVVLAVLLLLAFLVVPLVNQQLERQRREVCANNLRLIGAGMLMYAQEHDMHLPTAYENNVRSNRATWDEAMLNGYVKRRETFHCPDDRVRRDCSGGPRSYAISGGANTEWTHNWLFGAKLTLPELARRSEIVMVTEGWDGNKPHCIGSDWAFVRGRQVVSFHRHLVVGDPRTYSKTTNYLFLDGHVEWIENPSKERFAVMFPPLPPGYP